MPDRPKWTTQNEKHADQLYAKKKDEKIARDSQNAAGRVIEPKTNHKDYPKGKHPGSYKDPKTGEKKLFSRQYRA